MDFVHQPHSAPKYEFLLDNALTGGGVCLGDYDGDDLLDVFLTRPQGGNRLYRNLGRFLFEDVTQKSGLHESAWGLGATFADVDGDADLDLYACSHDCPTRLYINQGDGTFLERAREAGVDFSGSSVMMAFADYDLDGDLDGYLVTNRYEMGLGERKIPVKNGEPDYSVLGPELIDGLDRGDGASFWRRAAQFDHRYRNNGDGTFVDVTEQAGMAGRNFFGLSATALLQLKRLHFAMLARRPLL